MNLLSRLTNMAPSEDPEFISAREADEAVLGKLKEPAQPNELMNGEFYERVVANKKPLTASIFKEEEDHILTDAEKAYLTFTERHGFRGHEPSVLACMEQFRATKDKAQLYRALSIIHHLIDITK